MSIPLQQLDNAHVTVQMDLPGKHLVLEGWGRYETREEGNRLHIRVDDPEAPFTVVLDENTWTGDIRREMDGSYRVHLASA